MHGRLLGIFSVSNENTREIIFTKAVVFVYTLTGDKGQENSINRKKIEKRRGKENYATLAKILLNQFVVSRM